MMITTETMEKFTIQLQQRVPLPYLCFPEPAELSDENQVSILNTLITISKTNAFYSMSVIKKLIDTLERSNIEINEEYYEYLMEWLNSRALEPTDVDLITYTFNSNHKITIRESPNLISGLGTTGLRTWEASLFMSEYFLHNKLPAGDVLELGCGTGMVSISLLKQENKSHDGKLYITDGDSQLFERVKDNIELNDLKDVRDSYDIQKLWWGEDYIPNTVKTMIAADVTYDASVIPDLVHVINEGMTEGAVETAYVAATRRNEETLATWEKWLDIGVTDKVWTWRVISTFTAETPTNVFYGRHIIPIDLYLIEKCP